MAVRVVIVAREQAPDDLLEIVFGPRARLHEGHAAGRVRQEHMDQPRSPTGRIGGEPLHLRRDVRDQAAARVDAHADAVPVCEAARQLLPLLDNLVAAVLWPDRIIIFYIFPIKLKYFVMILGALAFFSVRDLNSGVSDFCT